MYKPIPLLEKDTKDVWINGVSEGHLQENPVRSKTQGQGHSQDYQIRSRSQDHGHVKGKLVG